MKNYIICILTTLMIHITFSSMSQQHNDIVIIVDVSGSINNMVAARNQAKEIIKGLIIGGKFDHSQYSDWEFNTGVGNLASIRQGKGQPLLGLNQKVFLRSAGEKSTSNNEGHFKKICNNLTEFETFLDKHYPNRFRDDYSYIKLAKSKAAQFAIKKNTCSYLLIELTDSREDRIPSSPYTSEEQDLVDSYGVRSNIETATVGIIRYRPVSNYQIIISEVNIIGNNCTAVAPCGVPQKTKLSPRIVINSMSKDSKSPRKLEPRDGKLTLSWQCIDCPDNTQYRAILKKVNGGQSTLFDSKSNLKSSSMTVKNIESGDYEFTVSAVGTLVGVKNQKGYFNVSQGSGLWVLLLLLALGVAGYFLYKYFTSDKREPKTVGRKVRNKQQNDDDFASGTNSSNSDFDF